jgi:phage shock protein E
MAAITPAELIGRVEQRTAPPVVDVRSREEFAAGHVPGAINVPFLEVGSNTAELGALVDAEVVVYCGHGPRAWVAGVALRRRGFKNVIYLKGHWAAWRRARLPVEGRRRPPTI